MVTALLGAESRGAGKALAYGQFDPGRALTSVRHHGGGVAAGLSLARRSASTWRGAGHARRRDDAAREDGLPVRDWMGATA